MDSRPVLTEEIVQKSYVVEAWRFMHATKRRVLYLTKLVEAVDGLNAARAMADRMKLRKHQWDGIDPKRSEYILRVFTMPEYVAMTKHSPEEME